MPRIIGVSLTVAMVLQGATLRAWGPTAHRAINHVAIVQLPDDVPAFVKRQVEWIAARSVAPDSWRTSAEPFLKIDEDPNHGWFMEQFAFMRSIPRSRYEFVIALHDEFLRVRRSDPARALRTNVRWTGTLPYAAVETYERIQAAMRQYRAAPEPFIELDVAFYVGWLGHYVADGAMPLHTSVHHDGWQGANPHGYTTDPRVHGRFESQFVDLIRFDASNLDGKIAAPKRLPDPFDAILEHLARSHARVEQVYRLDQAGAFTDAANREARDLVYACTADAATLLRDLVYTAWLESAGSRDSSPGIAPIDPKHPQYNPATGSAPAPRPRPPGR